MSVFQNLYTTAFEQNYQEQEQKTIIEELNFFDTYMTTLINTFEWGGSKLPKLPRFQYEKFLQYGGRMASFLEGGELKIFPAFPAGTLMEDGEFDRYTIIKLNGDTLTKPREEIEICFNNCFKIPYIYKVKHFSDKTALSLRAVDQSLSKAIVPTIIDCDSEEDLKIISGMLDGTKRLQPVVGMLREKFQDGGLRRETAFDNKEVDVLALWDVYVRYRNLFYSTFGINNVEIQKKERLTQAEGSGNDEIVRYSLLDDMFKNRKDFCERTNAHFGTDIYVELNRDTQTVFEESLDNKDKIEQAIIEISKGANIGKDVEKTDKEGDKDDGIQVE